MGLLAFTMKPLARWVLVLFFALAVSACNTGMQAVNDPHVLVAPKGRAVLILTQKMLGAVSGPLLDERGGCLGYTRSDAWFAARLPPGEQVIHLKDPDNMLSVKIDVEAGKTYFLRAALKQKGNGLDLIPIRPGSTEWRELDAYLASATQYAVDRKQCDSTLSEMVWMPGQDLPQLLAQGKKNANATELLIKADDGVAWRGSAKKSAR